MPLQVLLQHAAQRLELYTAGEGPWSLQSGRFPRWVSLHAYHPQTWLHSQLLTSVWVQLLCWWPAYSSPHRLSSPGACCGLGWCRGKQRWCLGGSTSGKVHRNTSAWQFTAPPGLAMHAPWVVSCSAGPCEACWQPLACSCPQRSVHRARHRAVQLQPVPDHPVLLHHVQVHDPHLPPRLLLPLGPWEARTPALPAGSCTTRHAGSWLPPLHPAPAIRLQQASRASQRWAAKRSLALWLQWTMTLDPEPLNPKYWAAGACDRPSWSLAGVVGIMSVGLVLLVFGETSFNLQGFIVVMAASCLSGLRWTITQLLLQGNDSHGEPLLAASPDSAPTLIATASSHQPSGRRPAAVLGFLVTYDSIVCCKLQSGMQPLRGLKRPKAWFVHQENWTASRALDHCARCAKSQHVCYAGRCFWQPSGGVGQPHARCAVRPPCISATTVAWSWLGPWRSVCLPVLMGCQVAWPQQNCTRRMQCMRWHILQALHVQHGQAASVWCAACAGLLHMFVFSMAFRQSMRMSPTEQKTRCWRVRSQRCQTEPGQQPQDTDLLFAVAQWWPWSCSWCPSWSSACGWSCRTRPTLRARTRCWSPPPSCPSAASSPSSWSGPSSQSSSRPRPSPSWWPAPSRSWLQASDVSLRV